MASTTKRAQRRTATDDTAARREPVVESATEETQNLSGTPQQQVTILGFVEEAVRSEPVLLLRSAQPGLRVDPYSTIYVPLSAAISHTPDMLPIATIACESRLVETLSLEAVESWNDMERPLCAWISNRTGGSIYLDNFAYLVEVRFALAAHPTIIHG